MHLLFINLSMIILCLLNMCSQAKDGEKTDVVDTFGLPPQEKIGKSKDANRPLMRREEKVSKPKENAMSPSGAGSPQSSLGLKSKKAEVHHEARLRQLAKRIAKRQETASNKSEHLAASAAAASAAVEPNRVTAVLPSQKELFTLGDWDPDNDDDAALDELEAMTIQAALQKKNWGPPAQQNCGWTPFANDGSCTKTCGGGKQPQTRRKAPNAAHGGNPCYGPASQTVPCKESACPTTTTTTTTTTSMTTAAQSTRMADVPIFLLPSLLASFTYALV